jgi:hypothetical protein
LAQLAAVFENSEDAESARRHLIQGGVDGSRISIIRQEDLAGRQEQSNTNTPIDSGAIGSAIVTGMELGTVAAIPFIGPLLAYGPLNRVASQTGEDLQDDFSETRNPFQKRWQRAVADGKIALLVETSDLTGLRDQLQQLHATIYDD